MNADLVVSVLASDVGYHMQISRFLYDGQRCGVGGKDSPTGKQIKHRKKIKWCHRKKIKSHRKKNKITQEKQ